MLNELAVILWPGVVVYAVWRFAGVAEKFAPPPPLPPSAPPEIPEDLVAWAQVYESQWAQEDMLRVIAERYAQLKDWDKVRRAVGVAQEPKP